MHRLCSLLNQQTSYLLTLLRRISTVQPIISRPMYSVYFLPSIKNINSVTDNVCTRSRSSPKPASCSYRKPVSPQAQLSLTT